MEASSLASDSERVRLGRDVLLVTQDGEARLLDMARGRFYGMDAHSVRMLTLALEHGPAETALCVSREFRVSQDQVRKDLDLFLRKLQKQGLTVRFSLDHLSRPPSRWTCAFLLTCGWLSLRLFGWARSVRVWSRWCRTSRFPIEAHLPLDLVRAVDVAVREAAARHLFGPECKERALVGCYLLRARYGLPAEMVVGIQYYPFSLHVWVECGPLIVTDDPDRCAMYTPVARYP